jgi:hypothetical protein
MAKWIVRREQYWGFAAYRHGNAVRTTRFAPAQYVLSLFLATDDVNRSMCTGFFSGNRFFRQFSTLHITLTLQCLRHPRSA